MGTGESAVESNERNIRVLCGVKGYCFIAQLKHSMHSTVLLNILLHILNKMTDSKSK
jgi:hypothetical protein